MTTFVRLEPKNKVDISQIIRAENLISNSNAASSANSSLQGRLSINNTTNSVTNFIQNNLDPAAVNNIRAELDRRNQQLTQEFVNSNNPDDPNAYQNFLLGAGLSNSGVTFLITPNVSESGSATYGEISDIRMPASIIYYLGSPSRLFTITGKLFARTKSEADYTYTIIRLLRSWRMPEKGAGQQGGGSGTELATGAGGQSTPKILQLSGYNGMFNNITVVMTELNFTFPDDVDYITASSGHKVPILSEVSITLKEGRSIQDLKQFDINSFRSGRLPNW